MKKQYLKRFLPAIVVLGSFVSVYGLYAVTAVKPVTPVFAASADYFLKIDGIDGESAAEGHRGEIEIMSWSWGATNSGPMSQGGGGGTGKVSFQDFHFMKRIDKASPKLLERAATGQHIKKAVLTARKSGSSSDYYVITFEDVLISSFKQEGGSSGDVPTESVSFNYQKITIEYKPQSSSGGANPPVMFTWDLKKGTKI
jgi:type VI secretion system secreted protein Hcp